MDLLLFEVLEAASLDATPWPQLGCCQVARPVVVVAVGACMPSSGWACREGGAVEALPIPVRRRGRMSYFVGFDKLGTRGTANTQHGLAVGACRLERGGRQGEGSRRSSPCAPPNFNFNAEDVI